MSMEEKAHLMETQGKFQDAIKIYLALISEVKKSEADDRELKIATFLYRAAACFSELGEYKKAIKVFDESIKVISKSSAEKANTLEHIAKCCADIGTCLLSFDDTEGDKNLQTALKFFDKAIDFTKKRVDLEEGVLKRFIHERAIIYQNFKAIIFLLLNKKEEAMSLINVHMQELEMLDVSGMGLDLTLFLKYLLEGKASEAKDILVSSIEPQSDRLSFAGPALRANLLGTFHKVLSNFVNDDKLHLQKAQIKEKGKVIINCKAYRNMMLHMLYYANSGIPESKWVETAGWLIGRIEGDDVFCVDAVPIMSGSSSEFAFKDEHYIKAAQIDDALYAEGKGEFIVGWYHSHPGLNLFLSHTDIINHLGFQSANPKAIALVFDHTKYDERRKNYGFDIYRLNDPNLATGSDYHKLEFTIEEIEEFPKDVPDWINSFTTEVTQLVGSKAKMTIKEISERLNYSELVLREIITDLKQNGFLRNLFYDIKDDQLVNEMGIRELIIQMVKEKDDGVLTFQEIHERVAITNTQIILLLEDMIRLNLLSGVIRKSSSDFLRT
ncbi:MAG: Mov34/MPN/PAD-1 family protein [Candidatus Helarchaeota archaeon]